MIELFVLLDVMLIKIPIEHQCEFLLLLQIAEVFVCCYCLVFRATDGSKIGPKLNSDPLPELRSTLCLIKQILKNIIRHIWKLIQLTLNK